MLARPGEPFDSVDHLFEVKWDGMRALAYVDADGYRIVSRHDNDITDRFPELSSLANLPPGTVLDGELVVLRDGKPSFSLLQTRAPVCCQVGSISADDETEMMEDYNSLQNHLAQKGDTP